MAVAPAEVEQYYKDHPGEFLQKERLKVWAITIRKSEEAIQKGIMDEAAKRKMGGLIAELKRSADFEKMAREHSEDGLAAKGGFVGFVERGEMAENIDQAIFALKEGQFSDILETETAYHLFKVGEKQLASQRSFEEAKDQIYDYLFRLKAHQRFVDWMDDLKKRAYISIR